MDSPSSTRWDDRVMMVAAAVIAVALVACGGQEGDETTTSEAPAETTTSGAAPATTTTEALAPPDDAFEVSIAAFAFNPNPVTIEAGQTVLWVNNEASFSHTATSEDGLWNSGSLRPDAQFFFTFDEPGEFDYFCNIHREMTATVIVE